MTRRSSSVTIREVAQQADVSVATVSRYINNSAPVSGEVAERIQHVMQALNYSPHATARQLATRKTNTIGLLLTSMHNNDFFGPLLTGVEEVSREHNFSLLVATWNAGKQNGCPLPIGPHNTDGVLVFADSLADGQITNWQRQGFPTVLIHRSPPRGVCLASVTVENKGATRKLIDHLIDVHQRRRILFFHGPLTQEDTHWRELGYKASLQAHGLTYDPALVLQGGFERQIAYQALMTYLSSKQERGSSALTFDAVFAGDDDAAVGVLQALHEAGISVPEEVSVAGFNDMRLAAYLNPPLTTVRAPTEQVGQMAAAQLFNVIGKQACEETILLPTEIILRRSCGCMIEPGEGYQNQSKDQLEFYREEVVAGEM